MSHLRLTASLALLLATGSCGYVVERSEMDSRLQALRTELTGRIDQGYQRTAADLSKRLDSLAARVDAWERDLRELEEEHGVKISQLEDALRFDVPVFFDYDSSELPEAGRSTLTRFAGVVRDYYPTSLVTVEGYTDAKGSQAYNLELGRRRGEAVKTFLLEKGLPGPSLRVVSYGEQAERLVNAAAQGPGSDGWENRRVVLVIDFVAASQPALTIGAIEPIR